MPDVVDRVRVLADDDGELLWFLGGLMVVKADSELSEGRLSLLDEFAPPDFSPPRHVHRDEDEIFYVLEGEVSVLVDGRSYEARPGAFVFLPKGLEHSFLTGPSGVRKLIVTTGRFSDFVRAASQRAAAHELPAPDGPPTEEQQRRLAEVAANFGMDITGPPITAEDVRTAAR
jgi:mannose-6-phosphate isomerase-like protein (cupin superfamily)